MINLKRLLTTLETLGVSGQHVELAIDELRGLLAELDEVEVKGREKVDSLLGCMLAIDAIIGDKEANNA